METKVAPRISTKVSQWLIVAAILTCAVVTAMVVLGLRNHDSGVAESDGTAPETTKAVERELSAQPDFR